MKFHGFSLNINTDAKIPDTKLQCMIPAVYRPLQMTVVTDVLHL